MSWPHVYSRGQLIWARFQLDAVGRAHYEGPWRPVVYSKRAPTDGFVNNGHFVLSPASPMPVYVPASYLRPADEFDPPILEAHELVPR